MAYIYGLILLLFSFNSFAGFPPNQTEFRLYSDQYGGNLFASGSSREAACVAADAKLSHLNAFERRACGAYYDWAYKLSNGNWGGWTGLISSTLICPASSQLNASSGLCECTGDTAEQNGSCVIADPCEMLADHCSALQGTKQYWSKPGQTVGDWTCRAASAVMGQEMFPGCNRGCMGENVGFSMAMKNDAGDWYTTGEAKMTGATCDPSTVNDLNGESDPDDPEPKPAENPDPTCLNGFKGTVNGVEVCVPPKASSGVTELEQKDNGDGTKTSSKTEVKCENGKCEITKTSTTTNTSSNTTTSSSSVTTTVDKASFCSQNKTANVCQDEENGGAFSGNCDSGFQCKGDAITCAIAKKQHQDYCEALKSPEHAAYVEAKGKTGKVTGDLEGNQTIDLMDHFGSNRDDFIGSGSCPQDRRIQLLYGELVIPYSQLCPWLEMLGNILVVVSSIAGARIIVTRFS